MQFGPPRPSGRLISLTPLIDVVFILLVFFMLASSFLDWRAVELSVSSGVTAAASRDRALVIGLEADGTVTVGAAPVARQALPAVMTERLAANPEQAIVIRSEPGVSLQRAVDTLDMLRTLGATRVSLSRRR